MTWTLINFFNLSYLSHNLFQFIYFNKKTNAIPSSEPNPRCSYCGVHNLRKHHTPPFTAYVRAYCRVGPSFAQSRSAGETIPGPSARMWPAQEGSGLDQGIWTSISGRCAVLRTDLVGRLPCPRIRPVIRASTPSRHLSL